MVRTRNLERALTTLAVLALPAGQAAASGFSVARFGGEHGHPTTDNPTAMYYNPAGLALKGGTRLYIDGTFAWRMMSYDRPVDAIGTILKDGEAGAGTPEGHLDANSGKATLFNVPASPFVGVTSDFGVPNLGVGVGLYVPLGGASAWDKDDGFKCTGGPADCFGGAIDGPNRWWSIEGTLRSLYITAAGAYRIPDLKLSFGAGINLVLSEVHTVRARNSSGDDELVTVLKNGEQTTTSVQEGRSLVDVSGKHLSASAGVIWEPTDGLLIGASYQSQPGFGEMKLEGKLDTILGAGGKSSQKIDFYQSLPDVFRLGARYKVTPESEVRLSGDFIRWSVFKNQCLVDQKSDNRKCPLDADGGSSNPGVIQNVRRDWENAFGVRAGGSYWFLPELETFFGLGYDGNAVPDETIDPALPDFHDVSAALGARWEILADKSLALAGTYTQFIYFSRDVAPSKITAWKVPSGQPNSGGKYTQAVGALNVNVEYTF